MPDLDPSYSNHSVQWSNLNCSIKFKNWLTAVKFAIACRHSLLMNELSTIIPCIWLLHLLCIRFYTGFIFLAVVDSDMIKMNVLPRLLYPIQMIPVLFSKRVLKDINGWLSSFIWNKRRPKLKMAVLLVTVRQIFNILYLKNL